MPTNPYFKDYSGEQDLTEDLTIEIIKTMGREMFYIPRNILELDKLFGEGVRVNYKNAVPLEMYIDSVSGFQGQGDIASKFGIEIKDNVFLTLSKKRFIQEIQTRFPKITRPREGDLVYFPLSKALFEINFVEHENPFYQHGKLYSYRLTCELFTYDQENVSTGNTDIDAVETQNRQYTYTVNMGPDITGITLHGYYGGENVYQVSGYTGNSAVEDDATATATIGVDPSGVTGIIELINIVGVFSIGNTIKGTESGIEAYILAGPTLSTNLILANNQDKSGAGDNEEIEAEVKKLDIFDFTEKDPFSEGNY